MLIDQPLEDPLGRMPLLIRRGQVLAQHLIDPPGHRLAHRCGPHRGLTIRRHRRGDRLPHRAAVHVILARQRPDRHPVALSKRIAANSSTLFDPIPAPPRDAPSPTPPTIRLARAVVPHQPGVSPPPSAKRGQIRATAPPRLVLGGAESEEANHYPDTAAQRGAAVEGCLAGGRHTDGIRANPAPPVFAADQRARHSGHGYGRG